MNKRRTEMLTKTGRNYMPLFPPGFEICCSFTLLSIHMPFPF